LVADTGKWIPGRKVLVSQVSLGEPDWSSRRFAVKLTKEQVEHSPSLDLDAPVSRQYEIKYHNHYGLPHYWSEFGVRGGVAYPDPPDAEKKVQIDTKELRFGDDNLSSAHEMTGYHIRVSDGEIGHVEDFIVDDETWTVRYMVVDTHNWLRGRKVLLAPTWIDSVDWAKNKVIVDLTKGQVKNSLEYNPSAPVKRSYEARLYDYYGQPKYWK